MQILDFFYPLFGCPGINFGPMSRHSFPSPVFIIAFYLFRPKGQRELRNEVGSQSPAKQLVGFKLKNS